MPSADNATIRHYWPTKPQDECCRETTTNPQNQTNEHSARSRHKSNACLMSEPMKMKLTINPTFRPIADIITTIPQTFDQSGETIYRGRNTVKIFDSPAGNLIVKKFGHHNIFQRIYYTFIGTGKACRAYRFASEYNARGIKSPQCIAYIEINHGQLLGDA